MVKIEPDCLYPMDELRTMLAGAVELPTFLDRLGLRDRRVFRDALWGWEILDASRQAKPFSELTKCEAASVIPIMRAGGSRGGRGKGRTDSPTRRLSARDFED